MDLNAERFIPADVPATWQALNDPVVLQACIPGCEKFEAAGENRYEVTLLAKVGPVSARFKGTMQLSDLQPPTAYALTFEGQGGVAGFAKGRAAVQLKPGSQDGVAGTLMHYEVSSQVGGKLAQIGSRLIDAAARKTADDFFDRFVAQFPSAAPVAAVPAPASWWARLAAWFARLFGKAG